MTNPTIKTMIESHLAENQKAIAEVVHAYEVLVAARHAMCPSNPECETVDEAMCKVYEAAETLSATIMDQERALNDAEVVQ